MIFKRFKNNKAFTLIELIVVIAVIGILILLAMPKFLSYTKDAKFVQIKNDVKAYENVIEAERMSNDNFIDDWFVIDKVELKDYKNEGSLFDKKNIVEGSYEFDDEYYRVPEGLVKTKLKGDFILAKDGKVYYYDKEMVNEEQNKKGDYEWVTSNEFGSYTGPNEERGYFKYIGTDQEVVEIPRVIEGVEMTSYFKMFQGIGGDMMKVVSTNNKITHMTLMFSEFRATSLDLSDLDTSSVTEMNSMFSRSKINSIVGLNTGNVINMNSMFSLSEIQDLDLSNFDTKNVVHMTSMFSSTKIKELDFSKFNTGNVINMSGMFSFSEFQKVDLSSFNTSKVVFMDQMFYNAQALDINLDDFDVKNVWSMDRMFGYTTKIRTLDLKSFEMKNVGNIENMFEKSNATTGYASTQEDADKLNASSGKPSSLTFVSK